ncbi:MAG: hypothetical protein ACE5JC_10105 [Candidatus Zixiibacteriota bacterium]
MEVIRAKKTLDSLEKEKVFGKLEGMYEIPKGCREEIEKFLGKYKHLFPILEEAEEQIVSVFGENIKLCLELHRDPEEGWNELFIVIKSEYSAEEAFRLENRLAEEWFLDRMKETKGKLNIIEEPLSL